MDNGIDFNNLDINVDVEGLIEDVKKVEADPDAALEFPDVPDGQYEIKIDKLELTLSKKGLPMLSGWFKIIDGEFEGSLLFMNQVITFALGLYKTKKFLRSLLNESYDDLEIEFQNFKQYNNLILDIYEIVAEKFEYIVEVTSNKKGFKDFEILQIFKK